MEERRGLIRWIKEHKKVLIAAGISIGTLILIILGIKNKDSLKSVWDSLKRITENPTPKAVEEVTRRISEIPIEPAPIVVPAVPSNSETLPFEVSRHIRNLPDGWHASQEKIEEAHNNNISLVEGQTWVESYTKGGAAA